MFGGTRIDEALFQDLEDALLMADAGVSATQFLIMELRRQARESKASTPDQLKDIVADLTKEIDHLTRTLVQDMDPRLLG